MASKSVAVAGGKTWLLGGIAFGGGKVDLFL